MPIVRVDKDANIAIPVAGSHPATAISISCALSHVQSTQLCELFGGL